MRERIDNLINKAKLYFNKKGQDKKDVIKISVISGIILTVLVLGLFYFGKSHAESKKTLPPTEISLMNFNSNKISTDYSENKMIDTTSKAPEGEREKQTRNEQEKTIESTKSITTQAEVKYLKDRLSKLPSRNGSRSIEHVSKRSADKSYPQRAIVFDESGKDKSELEEGTLIPVILLSSIVMKETKVPVRFKVTEDIYDDNGKLIITEGAIAFGALSIFNDQGRVFGRIKMIKVAGEKIKNIGADIMSSDESYGLAGIYYDETGKLLAGTLITTFLGSFAEGYKSSILTEMGDKVAKYSEGNIKNALSNALEKTALFEAKREAEDLKKTKPFVVVPHGTLALLMVGNNME